MAVNFSVKNDTGLILTNVICVVCMNLERRQMKCKVEYSYAFFQQQKIDVIYFFIGLSI